MTTITIPQRPEMRAATAQWRQRVFRISSLCEILFGSIWIANAVRSHNPVASPIILLIGVAVLAISIRTTRGTGRRPRGRDARALEHEITIATATQIIASVALPAALVTVGRNYLIMPAIIVTVGVLFVWLHQLLHVPRLGALGVALVLVPIATAVALSGNAQTTSALVIAGTLMIATGTTGVRTLAAHAPAAPTDPAEDHI